MVRIGSKKIFGVWMVCFLWSGCAPRVATGPSQVPQLQKDYDSNQKQIYVRGGNLQDVVYTNYTPEQLEQIQEGKPLQQFEAQSESATQETVQWPVVDHTYQAQTNFMLLHDDNESQGDLP
jgi:hypothetical protein